MNDKIVTKEFFDLTFYNKDTFAVANNHTLLAEVYFRLDID